MRDESQSDEALMLEYKQGNQAAFEALYIRYKDVLYRYFVRHCNDTHQSEELYQEVWIKLINNIDNYEPKAKFTTYLFTIAHNTLVDFYRKTKPRQVIEFEDTEAEESIQQQTSSLTLPEDEFTLKQKTKHFMQTLEQLPANQKEAILLHLDQEMNVHQIAEVTQVKMETAKSRLRYAKNKLKVSITS